MQIVTPILSKHSRTKPYVFSDQGTTVKGLLDRYHGGYRLDMKLYAFIFDINFPTTYDSTFWRERERQETRRREDCLLR